MLRILALSLFFSSISAFALETVPYVDPSRYVGRWYQMARKPLFFEPQNCACAQQTLNILETGAVGVYNSCNEGGPSGPLRDIRGEAVIVDPVSNAKLSVDFNQPFKGSYWIIGLDEDYRWAVVSDQYEFSLYILSKTPDLAPDLYEAALASAARQLRTDGLVRTSHSGCTYPANY